MKSNTASSLKRQIWRESLAALTVQCLGYADVNPRTHGDMINVLESSTRRKLVVMPRGTFKCLSPNSRIMNEHGTPKAIVDAKVGDKIASWKNGFLVVSKITGKEIQLNRKMLRIVFRSGVTLECSENHPLLTIKGFVKSSELKIGQRIAHWAGKVMDFGEDAPMGHPWILGALVGDGSLSHNQVRLSGFNQKLIEKAQKEITRAGFKSEYRKDIGILNISGGIRNALKHYGLSNSTSWTKKVPDQVFTWSLKDRREFIAAYFSCDAHCHKQGDTVLSTVSKQLAFDTHDLLKTIGVFSTVNYYEYEKAQFYVVTIKDFISQKNFMLCPVKMKKRAPAISSQDGFYRNVPSEWREVKKPFQSRKKGCRTDNDYDTGFTKFRKFAEEIGMEWACTDEIVWDRIKSIEKYTGTAIDIEVENTHTFMVEGIITHNTTVASVAYPIWLLANNPNLRIMLDSELYTNSKMRVREIRGHLDSQHFIDHMGNWKGPVWSDGELIVSGRTKILKEPSIFASGISASKTGVHADYIIADDLNSPLNTNKRENAEKVLQHVRYYTSILDPEGTLVFIGTRYSQLDVYQNIINTQLTDDQKLMIEIM